MSSQLPELSIVVNGEKQNVVVEVDDLSDGQIAMLLDEHLRDMHRHSPAESIHALPNSALQDSSLTFFAVRVDQTLAGCGALKELGSRHGEVKSMRTAHNFLRQGVAAQLLRAIILEAQSRSYQRLSLETGTSDAFTPAQNLYERFGFMECEPFSDYQLDEHSKFYTLRI